jgi:WD40 repeat protein
MGTKAPLRIEMLDGLGWRYDFSMRAVRAIAPAIVIVQLFSGLQRPLLAVPYREGAFARETQAWVARFNGAASMDDTANAVAISPDGSRVFVTGRSYLSDWTNEFVTLAYDGSSGAQLWEAEYSNGSAVAKDIAVSPDGSTVFVTGWTYLSVPSSVTVAYDAVTGDQKWAADPVSNSSEFALTVSPDGSTVAVTGNGPYFSKMTTIGYNAADGSRRWVAWLTDGGYETTTGTDITVSPDGRVFYATGYAYNGNSHEYLTEAIDGSTGHMLWGAKYNSPDSGYDEAYGVAVSPDGARVFVTGCSSGVYCIGSDFGTVAYDAVTGRELWVRIYDTGATDVAKAIRISPDGTKVFVTGSSGMSRGEDYATIAYDTDGNQLWLATYDGPSHKGDFANDLGVSPDGCCVYVTGGSVGRSPQLDFATVAYDASTGIQLGVDRYDGPAHGDDTANALAVGANGEVFITGRSQGPRTSYDYATVAIQA